MWLYDADGKRYLDVYNNVPVVGHCHPQVVEALTRQAATLNVHTRYLHKTILEYCERLTATFDDPLSMTFLTCTGSEANEIALRMARLYGRDGDYLYRRHVSRQYHRGRRIVDDSPCRQDPRPECTRHTFPDSYRPLNGLSGEALADAHADTVKTTIDRFIADGTGFAGMLICPIFANEGLPIVPPGHMEKAIKHVRAASGLYVADQVQSGFGRTGRMWGHEISGIVPDIVTLGKPTGNGNPWPAASPAPICPTSFATR